MRPIFILSSLLALTSTSAFAEMACTQEAMICPDGSAVGRTGPNCEFAPCPGGGASGSVQAGKGSSGPGVIVSTDEMGFAKYPDLPLDNVSSSPLTVAFVIEHRTALNGQRIVVRGLVSNIDPSIEPADPSGTRMGLPMHRPRVTLSDGGYEAEVMVQDSDIPAFTAGVMMDIPVTVTLGNKTDLILTKN